MKECSFYSDDRTPVNRTACSAHGDRHPIACAKELAEEVRRLNLQVEKLKDKYETCEQCDGSTDAGVFCVPCWNRVNLQVRDLHNWARERAREHHNLAVEKLADDEMCSQHNALSSAYFRLADEIERRGVEKRNCDINNPGPIQGCKVCGSKLATIRGKIPRQPDREVCPTCAQERLEDLLARQSPDYGRSVTDKRD